MSDSHHNRGEPEAEPVPETTEQVLITSLVRALLRTMPKAKRRELLREMTEDLKWQAEMASLLHLRPNAHEGETAAARRRAHALWVRIVDRLMAQLDR